MSEAVQIVLATGLVAVGGSLGATWLASWLQERRDRNARLRVLRLKALDEAEEGARLALDIVLSRHDQLTETREESRERKKMIRRGFAMDYSALADPDVVEAFIAALTRSLDTPIDDPEVMSVEVRDAWTAMQASVRRRREEIESDKS